MEHTASEIIKRLRRLSLPSQLTAHALDQELVRSDLERLLAERDGTASEHEAALQQIAQLTAERESMRRAIEAFLKVWPEAEKQINGSIVLQSLRAGHDTYTGPSLTPALDGLRAALSASPQEK